MNRQPIIQIKPSFDKKESEALTEYLKNDGWGGEYVKTEEFEKMIAEFTQAKHASVTINGTVSLILAQLALEMKRGDEILVPDMTMIASPNSAVLLGIKPVLVDIEESTLCMDLERAEELITAKTKALMYVPFNGRCGNMDKVVEFCNQHNLFLIEDSAQALGSFYKGKHLGNFGDVGSFSFSTAKIISTGQGGAIITRHKKLFDKIEKIKDFGRIRGGIDIHDDWGWNFKFSDFLAVIGIEQMKKLDERIKRKREIYRRYQDSLKDNKSVELIETNLDETTPWFVDIFIDNPSQLKSYLETKKIGTRLIYPAIHKQKIFDKDYRGKEFPVAERAAGRGLWLPSLITLTNEEIDFICEEIVNFFK